MPTLSASVVLCTCEGERFLPEQLASLRNQTRPALEIIAQDDASKDGTFALLTADPAIKAFRNPNRLGFAANFAVALAKARGDIIFLCDQDDIWEKEKIDLLLKRFEENPRLNVVCSEASRIDEQGAPLPGLVLAGNGVGEEERALWGAGKAFPRLIRINSVPGMTMAFRASLRERLLPIPPGWEHDYWILLVAAGLGESIAMEPRALVRYRQHGGQVIGGKKSLSQRWAGAAAGGIAMRTKEADRWIPVLERLRGAAPEVLALAKEKRAHLLRRGSFSRSRPLRALQIAAEFLRGGYHRYDAGLSSAIKDLLSY
ncbi:MAG: glycosyltransferase [Bdellovibrionota bacterium]